MLCDSGLIPCVYTSPPPQKKRKRFGVGVDDVVVWDVPSEGGGLLNPGKTRGDSNKVFVKQKIIIFVPGKDPRGFV